MATFRVSASNMAAQRTDCRNLGPHEPRYRSAASPARSTSPLRPPCIGRMKTSGSLMPPKSPEISTHAYWSSEQVELAIDLAVKDRHQPTGQSLIAIGCLLGMF